MGELQADRILKRHSQFLEWNTICEMGGNRRKDVAAMEGTADIRPPELGLVEMDDPDLPLALLCCLEQGCQESVIRSNIQLVSQLCCQWTPRGPNTGVHDVNMNRAS